jgi:hypothetical protein
MKTLLFKISVVVMVFTTGIKAQSAKYATSKFINIELNISLDGSHKKDTSYQVNVKNLTLQQETTLHTACKTMLHLDYNAQYEITISHTGYSAKVIELDTEAPVDKWLIMADVNLDNKNKQTVHAGKITFDPGSKTFKPVKKV